MGGFMGIGNSSAKTDRGRALGGWNAEWENLAHRRAFEGQMTPAAQANQAGAQSSINAGADFWKNILGSRSDQAAAMAPETNAIAGQADQLRQAQASLGTSRGGGVAAQNQQAQTGVQSAINNAMLQARPQAAQGAVQAGQAQGQLAAQQLHAALTAMGMSDEIAKQIVDQSIRSRVDSAALNKGVANQWLGLAGNLLGLGGPTAAKIGGAIGGAAG